MTRAWLSGGHATLADLDTCAALLRGGSRTFFAAALLLPRAVRESATALYAFCRLADDAVDEADSAAARVARLGALRERLDAAYDGRPHGHAADRALADVIVRHAIPRALPAALLEGFEWDAQARRYATLADLHGYATRVAGSVGAMMALLMGTRTPAALGRAFDLGIAMQLTNICRDVGEDARAGRLYLPTDWLQAQGLAPDAFVCAPVAARPLAQVLAALLTEADRLYARGGDGIKALPRACRPAMHAARVLYAEIGREVERNQYDAVSRRAVVPVGRKARGVSAAVVAATASGPLDDLGVSPAEPAYRALIAAVQALPAPAAATTAGSAGEDRVPALIALFERLERREREVGLVAPST